MPKEKNQLIYLDDCSLIRSRLVIMDITVWMIESLAFTCLTLRHSVGCWTDAAATSTVTEGCELAYSFMFTSNVESLLDKWTRVTNNLLKVLRICEREIECKNAKNRIVSKLKFMLIFTSLLGQSKKYCGTTIGFSIRKYLTSHWRAFKLYLA